MHERDIHGEFLLTEAANLFFAKLITGDPDYDPAQFRKTFDFNHNLNKIATDKNSYQAEFQNRCDQRRVEDSAVFKMGVYLGVAH
jgi:hypothetical protein